MMIAASKAPTASGATRIPDTPGKAISGCGAGSALNAATSLPSAFSAKAIASCEPIESPSGLACDERTKRCRVWIASTICWISGLVVIGLRVRGLDLGCRVGIGVCRMVRGADFAEQLLDPVLAGDRVIVEELDLRGALQPGAPR